MWRRRREWRRERRLEAFEPEPEIPESGEPEEDEVFGLEEEIDNW